MSVDLITIGGTLVKSVAIDLDTTLNTLDECWLSRYNKDYNDNLTPEDILSWEIEKYVKCGTEIYKYLSEPGFFRNLGIREYAQEVTKWMVERCTLKIVTAYVPEACVDKCAWVDHYLPHIGHRNVIFCNDKQYIDMNYLIDDGAHNITSFKGTGIIFDRANNRHLKNHIRFNNWLEIGGYFGYEQT